MFMIAIPIEISAQEVSYQLGIGKRVDPSRVRFVRIGSGLGQPVPHSYMDLINLSAPKMSRSADLVLK